jgi:tol-pal system protein YbgF
MKYSGAVVAVACSAFVALAPAIASAANKEHAQLMAEIRILQQQQQQLQQSINELTGALKTISTKMDTQTNAMQKSFADQNLLINNIGETVRILREKADDTNVRLSTITQEIQAMRQTVASAPPPAVPGAEPPAGEAPGGQPSSAVPGSAAFNPPPANISPTRMYEQAMADYSAGQYELAVEGLQAFIRTFPTSPNADDAQLHSGYSLYAAGKFSEAAAALQKVITDYPQSNSVPPAYYKLGLTFEALKQPEDARKAYEIVIKNHPNTTDATFAQQALERMKRKG